MCASTAHRFIAIVLVATYLQPFITSVSGAYLQYQTTRVSGNVTLTPGRRETVFCRQHDGAPVATAIQWYNPEGRLVSRNSGDSVYQFVVDHGRVAYLNFISYNHSLKGRYECRVHHANDSVETLSLCIVPASLIQPTPVEWEKVCWLKPAPNINYRGLIMQNRTPALFPGLDPCNGIGLDVYIGALYVNTISGYPSRRRVYFEASNPNLPIMRVPKSIDEEQEVIDSFSWDRKNFVYQKVGDSFDGTRDFKIFTPANIGSYGIPVGLDAFDGLTIFIKKQPGGIDFTEFQIKGGESEAHITTDDGNKGLYVDMDDEEQGGWKVKITANQSLWNKFRITSADFPITYVRDVC